jgi:hypothetical protein
MLNSLKNIYKFRLVNHLGLFVPIDENYCVYTYFTSQNITYLPQNIKIINRGDIQYPFICMNPPLLTEINVIDNFLSISKNPNNIPKEMKNKLLYDTFENIKKSYDDLSLSAVDLLNENIKLNAHTPEYITEQIKFKNNILQKDFNSYKYRKLTSQEKLYFNKKLIN